MKLNNSHRNDQPDDLSDITDSDSIHQHVYKASGLLKNRMGDVEVSLFWEEKLIMIWRFLQLYGLFMVVFYEEWPSQTRVSIGGVFMFMSGSLHLMVDFYGVIQSFNSVIANFSVYIGILAFSVIFTLLTFLKWKFRLRLLKKKKFNSFKLIIYFWEIMFLPFLLNILFLGRCNFDSGKDAV